jgi:hypothetical protein
MASASGGLEIQNVPEQKPFQPSYPKFTLNELIPGHFRVLEDLQQSLAIGLLNPSS